MKPTIDIPDDWTPEQALAVCELLDDIISAIWHAYTEPLAQLCQREAMCDAVRELEQLYDTDLYSADADDILF